MKALLLLVPLAFGQFSEEAATVPAAKAAAPAPAPFPIADAPWRAQFLAKLKTRFLDDSPGSDKNTHPCSNAASILYFLNEDIVYLDRTSKEESTAKAVKADRATLSKWLEETMDESEVVFAPTWYRDKCIKASGGGTALAAALDPKLKAGLNDPERGDCRRVIGAKKEKNAVLIFNADGTQASSPVDSLNHTAPHEVLHLLLAKRKVKDQKIHHGLTDWLGWGSSTFANSAAFKVPAEGCKKYSK